ncbi:hypothetical protein D3C83_37980 [compost metagenome]
MVLVRLVELRGAEDLHLDLAAGVGLHVSGELLQVLRRVVRGRELVRQAHGVVCAERARRAARGGEGGQDGRLRVSHFYSSGNVDRTDSFIMSRTTGGLPFF